MTSKPRGTIITRRNIRTRVFARTATISTGRTSRSRSRSTPSSNRSRCRSTCHHPERRRCSRSPQPMLTPLVRQPSRAKLSQKFFFFLRALPDGGRIRAARSFSVRRLARERSIISISMPCAAISKGWTRESTSLARRISRCEGCAPAIIARFSFAPAGRSHRWPMRRA